jgi:hypothetical protein
MIRIARWPSALVLFGLALTVDLAQISQRPAAELVVEMQASESSQAKVFYDTGAGFNEVESATRSIPADNAIHRLLFPLPTKPVRSIRFDPLEVTGLVQIRAVFIEKSDSDILLLQLDTSKIAPANEIRSVTARADGLEVAIVENARDPQLLLPIDRPLVFHHSADELFSRHNLRKTAVLFLLAAVAAAVIFGHRRFEAPVRAIDAFFDQCCRRFSGSKAFPFDKGALWFYAICLLVFVVFALAKFHGSSISIAGASYRAWTDAAHEPLLGTPKKVRSDEWSFHTPTILNQIYRRDPLAVNDTLLGPGKAALLGNIPCYHFTQIFRPQFWAFFVFPADQAFAIYWQCKGLFLLTGVFTLLFLLTRSSAIAAVCALWYFFSAYTQWAYSWASLLPEMVGLFSWTVALTCYLIVGRNRVRLALAAFLCAFCAINFALCIYPPHQIPLATFGGAIVAGWLWHHWRDFVRGPQFFARIVCLAAAWLLVAAILGWFYFDAKETIAAAAGTIYPGQRSSSGGGVKLSQFLSHFLDFWKSEENFPSNQGNICEASGYLWLAPFTLFLARPVKRLRLPTPVIIFSWIAFLLLLSWTLFPIPARVGHWILFDRVPPFRSYHALGLINVTLVGMFLTEQRRARLVPHLVQNHPVRSLGVTLIVAWLLFRMNKSLGHFFPQWQIWVALLYTALLVLLLFQARQGVFALCLLLPLALANGLINPLDRGLDVIRNSSLFKAVHETHKEWRDGKWVIFAPWADEPGLLAATGLDVVDCLRIIPDRKAMGVFDDTGQYADIINRSSYFFAIPLPSGQASSFETPSAGNVLWRVNPIDPRLKQIGVNRVAFAYQPPAKEFAGPLAPHLETSLPGLQIYRLR